MHLLSDLLKTVLDPKYTSHDSFALFNKIMEVTHRWFESDVSRVSQSLC